MPRFPLPALLLAGLMPPAAPVASQTIQRCEAADGRVSYCNVLTTRRYYSTEDVDQMDAQNAALAADYRRFCSR